MASDIISSNELSGVKHFIPITEANPNTDTCGSIRYRTATRMPPPAVSKNFCLGSRARSFFFNSSMSFVVIRWIDSVNCLLFLEGNMFHGTFCCHCSRTTNISCKLSTFHHNIKIFLQGLTYFYIRPILCFSYHTTSAPNSKARAQPSSRIRAIIRAYV